MNIPLNAAMRGLESGVSFAGDNAILANELVKLAEDISKLDSALVALDVGKAVGQGIASIKSGVSSFQRCGEIMRSRGVRVPPELTKITSHLESAIRAAKDFEAACKKMEREYAQMKSDKERSVKDLMRRNAK